MKIVDEFTGRVLEGRRYSEGLHQAIEAKEGVTIKDENQTLATITLQNYFRLYEKLAGMTGTAETEAAEFAQIYSLEVIADPHQPGRRPRRRGRPRLQVRERQVRSRRGRYRRRHEISAAGAVGTVSIEKSEKLSKAWSIAGSSTRCSTPSTTPGRPTSSPRPGGRGQSRLPPTWPAAALTSNSAAIRMEWPAPSSNGGGSTHDDPSYEELEQKLTQEFEEQIAPDKQRVIDAGGLYVVGTERHESRRIDNQLRGRSGRQGDPGESRFYLSLEDDLMRRFQGSGSPGSWIVSVFPTTSRSRPAWSPRRSSAPSARWSRRTSRSARTS